MRNNVWRLVLGVSGSALLWAPSGMAQPDSKAIEELKLQIKELDQKVRVLERKRELEQEAAAEKAKTASSVSLGASGLAIQSGDTNFVLRIRGGVQTDARFYLGDASVNDTFLIRRARPILEGTVFKNFDYRIMLDISSGTANTAANNGFLLDGYGDANFSPALRLRAGKFKEPVGLERLQSWNNLLFLERGYPTQLVPNRDVGFMAHGELWNAALQYQAGAFNGTLDGASSDFDLSDNDKDVAGRLFAHPFRNLGVEGLRNLGLGVSGTFGDHGGTPRSYLSPGAQRFFSFRSGTGANPNVLNEGEAWRISPQGYFYWGPFGLFGEYVLSSQGVRQAGGGAGAGLETDLNNRAWQVAVSYFLTGEANSYRPVTARKPVTLSGGGWGAFELTARVGELSIDDDAFPVFADGATSARNAFSWAAGLNWHLNRNVKLQFNYEQTQFEGGSDNPATAETERVILSRVQITF